MASRLTSLTLVFIIALFAGAYACSDHSECGNDEFCGSFEGVSDSCLDCWFCTMGFQSLTGCDGCDGSETGGTDDGNDTGGETGEEESTTVTSTATTTATTEGSDATTQSGDPFECTEQQVASGACVCPKNCGSGGCKQISADPEDVQCTSCSKGKFLVDGWCTSSFDCKANKVINNDKRAGLACSCTIKNCNECRAVFGKEEKCFNCKNKKYKFDGQCLDSCPANYSNVGTGTFKRKCVLAGECIKGFINVNGVKVEDAPCKCKLTSCQSCKFDEGQLGGEPCTKCQNKKYLLDGGCKSDCSEAAEGMIAYKPGRVGRECRMPFKCTNGVDESGAECKCKNCMDCDINATQTCLKCDSSNKPYRFLEDGACVKNCKSGSTAVEVNPGEFKCMQV